MDAPDKPTILCIDCGIPVRHSWTEAVTVNGKRFSREHFDCRSCARLQYRDVIEH